VRHIILIVLFASAAATAAADSRVPLPNLPSARSQVSPTQRCVEPTEIMRKNHMKFLLHQRDETVHEGIWTKKHSLVECISCHNSNDQNGETIAINAPGQFCQSCHAYAGVQIDCFQCHATTPVAP
jgi:hypothetical protein